MINSEDLINNIMSHTAFGALTGVFVTYGLKHYAGRVRHADATKLSTAHINSDAETWKELGREFDIKMKAASHWCYPLNDDFFRCLVLRSKYPNFARAFMLRAVRNYASFVLNTHESTIETFLKGRIETNSWKAVAQEVLSKIDYITSFSPADMRLH